MHRALFSRPAREAARLCKACLRARARALPAATRATARPLHHDARATARSPPLAVASRKASTAQGKTPAGTARQTPPRFYALFPETLPAGPPPAGPFRVDVRALRREFLRLQAAAHPDFHHAASGASDVQAASRARAEAASALINEAYKTLSSPLLRAQYLLRELHDADLAGDEAGAAAEADPELLGLVLEAREAIEEAADERDLAELQRENDERIRLAEEGLEAAFCTGDISAAKAEAVRLRYWTNIKQSLEDWENGKPVVLQH